MSYCKPDGTGSSYCTQREPKKPVCTNDDCQVITSKNFPVSVFNGDTYFLIYNPNSQETFYMFDNLIYKSNSCLSTYNDSGFTFVTFGDYNDPDSNLCGSENNTKFKLNNDYTISTLDGSLTMYYLPLPLSGGSKIVLSADHPSSSSWIPLKFIN
jgi:hypothetical protein